jgi:hypothetical protein
MKYNYSNQLRIICQDESIFSDLHIVLSFDLDTIDDNFIIDI